MVPDCGGLRSAGMWLLVARPSAGLLWLVSGLAGSHDTFRADGKGQVLQGPALGTVTDLMFNLGVLTLLKGPEEGLRQPDIPTYVYTFSPGGRCCRRHPLM